MKSIALSLVIYILIDRFSFFLSSIFLYILLRSTSFFFFLLFYFSFFKYILHQNEPEKVLSRNFYDLCANDTRVTLSILLNMLNTHSLFFRNNDKKRKIKKKRKKRKTSLSHPHSFFHYISDTHFFIKTICFFFIFSHQQSTTFSLIRSCSHTFCFRDCYNRLKNTHSLKKIKRYTHSTGTADG